MADEPTAPQEWCVHWTMVVSGRDPEEAARNALDAQRRDGSIATVFEVYRHDAEHQRGERYSGEERVAVVDLGNGTEPAVVEYDE